MVPGIRVRAALEAAAISDSQSHTYGAFTNSLTIPPDLTVLVYVGVCSAVISRDNIDRFDSDWVRTFHAIESEIPTLAAVQATTNPEISIILDLQCRVVVFLYKDTILV